jgi:excisionase family DNA binding protein
MNTRESPTRRNGKPDAAETPIDTLLTAIGVAGYLGKTLDATRKMISRGQIPGAVRLGREWRVKQSVFAKFIDTLLEDYHRQE